MADEIEKNGIAKEALSPIYMNLTSEDNPYKIREYLLREGLELDKHFKGASEKLRRRADDLDLKYSVKEDSVLKSREYQGLLLEHEKRYGSQLNPKVSMDIWNTEHQKVKARAADLIQSPITAQGIMPISEDDMAAIWANKEARDYWLMNPADDLSAIKKRYKMVEEKVDEGEVGVDTVGTVGTVGQEVMALEERLETLKTSGFTTLPEYKSIQTELGKKKKELEESREEEDLLRAAASTGIPIEVLRREKRRQRTPGKVPIYDIFPD